MIFCSSRHSEWPWLLWGCCCCCGGLVYIFSPKHQQRNSLNRFSSVPPPPLLITYCFNPLTSAATCCLSSSYLHALFLFTATPPGPPAELIDCSFPVISCGRQQSCCGIILQGAIIHGNMTRAIRGRTVAESISWYRYPVIENNKLCNFK